MQNKTTSPLLDLPTMAEMRAEEVRERKEYLKNVRAIEVDDNMKILFNNLPVSIQEQILNQKCVNCRESLNKKDIMYVICSDGQIRWWHETIFTPSISKRKIKGKYIHCK